MNIVWFSRHEQKESTLVVQAGVCVPTPVSKGTNLSISSCAPLVPFIHSVQMQGVPQGVVARQRVYHQRRRSLSLGDTGTDHPSVPAQF